MAGAVLLGASARGGAQVPVPVPVPRPDSIARPPVQRPALDSLVQARAAQDSAAARAARTRDSLDAFRKSDTLRAAFTASEAPRSLDIGGAYRWDREELQASGANTLADLLEHVPGALGVRAAWIVDQESATYLGDFGRVRVFVDGLPFAPPDVKDEHGISLANTPGQSADTLLWQFESCTIERGAAELRVYLRSWRANKTIPYTRVDVYTGDQELNVFRGYFAQRFGPGLGVQVAAENLSLSQSRTGGDGSRRSGMVRLGWAAGRWSVDAFHEYADHFRRDQARQSPLSLIPSFSPSASISYVRVGYGDPEQGTWAQALASTTGFASLAAEINGTVDTTRKFSLRRSQYAFFAGTSWGALRVSAGLRALSILERSFMSPQARVSYARGWLSAQAYGERSMEDSTTHGDVSVRVAPRPWLALAASYGGSGTGDTLGRRVRGYASRLELGVRVRPALWLTGGVLRRDAAWVKAPLRYDTLMAPSLTGPAQATYLGLRGRVYDELFADIVGLQWDQAGAYRPRYQTRAELYIKTRWLHRFPSGAFGLLWSIAHEYKEPAAFPMRAGAITATGYSRNIITKLEIRILTGVLSWQWRNVAGEFMDQVPGALLPRANSVYGIRWEFTN